MPAGITVTNGKAEMAYIGETPWHGLGTRVEQAMTAAEALEMAGLDWEVGKVGVRTDDGLEIPGRYATVRTDTRRPLGVVGSATP